MLCKVLLVLLLCGYVHCVEFQPCKNMPDKNVKVNNLTIPGCDAAPCVFKKGQNATITFSFTPSVDAAAVIEAKVCGIIAGVCVPIPGGFHPEHMCDVLKCPLKANTAYSITETVYINKTWPSITLVAEISFEDTAMTGCFETAMKVE